MSTITGYAETSNDMSSETESSLSQIYCSYIKAIRDHDLAKIDEYVSETVVHNDKHLGLQGYKELLCRNIIQTEVSIEIKRLIADKNHVAAVLIFTTKPSTESLVGIRLDGRPFSYAENVIYDFKDGKIVEVHSLFDIDTVRSHGCRT